MPEANNEIVVDDPQAPADDSPALAGDRKVEIVTSLLLLAFAALMAFDNWRIGMGWAPDGPRAGYFPFYLSVILGAASLYGLVACLVRRAREDKTFVTRDQFRRVLQVFVPTCLFCLATQWLGIYVASLLLVAGFTWFAYRWRLDQVVGPLDGPFGYRNASGAFLAVAACAWLTAGVALRRPWWVALCAVPAAIASIAAVRDATTLPLSRRCLPRASTKKVAVITTGPSASRA